MSSLQTALSAAVLAVIASQAGGHVEVHDAYVAPPDPGASGRSAFMVLHNHDEAEDRLLSASTPAADRVELHETLVDGASDRMAVLTEGIRVSAYEEVALQPQGLHLMLIGLKETLEDSDTVTLTLTFEHAGETVIDVPVHREASRPGTSAERASHQH